MSDFEIKLKSFVELTDVANEKVKLQPFCCGRESSCCAIQKEASLSAQEFNSDSKCIL